jgi:hypothetical protein
MSSPQKPKVVLRTSDAKTARDLRQIVAQWCELHRVKDLKSIENVCKDPSALIVDATTLLPNGSTGARGAEDEAIQFLIAARKKFPATRRVMIADPDDLSATIHGLHTGAVDCLLHRPFDIASVLIALRLQKPHSAPAAECLAR